jgi:sentrin-specific protease 8
MAMKREDAIVLNYHDSLLRESDLKLLDESNWLNDQIISFVFEYFEYEKYNSLVEENKIIFLNPNFTQILKINNDMGQLIEVFLDPLEVLKTEVIIFPINNNSTATIAGGSHWSIMAIYKNEHRFVHYDSFHSANKEIAIKIYNKFKSYFQCNHFHEEITCPQQSNTSDCGVYLLAIADAIANSLLTKTSLDLTRITPDFILKLRINYKNLIRSLDK